jgi:hypothetical protein
MSEPMFVSVDGDQWVNVEHIVGVGPAPDDDKACVVYLTTGDMMLVQTPARDFLNRMTGEVWK